MLHILLVDDAPDDIALIRRAIAASGLRMTLHVAENAVQAYDFLSGRGPSPKLPTPDLILLDVHLPIVNGKQALQVIRSDPRWSPIPVVMLTGTAPPEDEAECLRLGAKAYLMKPKDLEGYVAMFGMLSGKISGWTTP